MPMPRAQHLRVMTKADPVQLPCANPGCKPYLCVQANLCSYLELLCADDALAHLLMDTKLPTQLASLLASLRNGILRAHVAACLGLLIRYATFIAPSHAGVPQFCFSCWCGAPVSQLETTYDLL